MPSINLSSPIAIVVDRLHRQAVASTNVSASKAHSRDGFGKGFISKFFVSTDALAEALEPELLSLVNDQTIEPLLPGKLKAQIRTELLSNSHHVARLIVVRLSSQDHTNLQAAILAFLKSRPGTSFCFQAPTNGTAQIARSSRPVPSLRTSYPGRDDEAKGIVDALLDPAQSTPSVLLGGVGGIGKTTLALMVLNEEAVKGRYGERRFWVNCETTSSAEGFLEIVVATLSSASALSDLFSLPRDNVEQSFLGLLDRIRDGGEPERAIVAFDNLETIFDTEPALVERVLAVLLTRSAVLVTMRGERRPYISGPWSWPRSKDGWIERLSDRAWRPALDAHAGFHLNHDDYATIEPVLRQVDGYPLALSLLGCRLARGESTVHDLKMAWDIELSREASTDDTRETSIVYSIRVSLRSPSVARTPFAVDTLILAAHLPPGLCRSREGDRLQAFNGLPKRLGRALCETEEAQTRAWAALTRCGLAHIDPTAPDRLQLLPPIQETLRRHWSVTSLPASKQDATMEALDRVYRDDREVATAFSRSDNGDFGRAALENLERGGLLVPDRLQTHDDSPTNGIAQSLRLLATSCRNAGFLVSGQILFHEADLRYTTLNHARHALCMRASKLRLGSRISQYEDRLQDAMEFAEEEASCWDKVPSPQDAAWARANALDNHAGMARLEGHFEHAVELYSDEMAMWNQEIAERHNQPEEALRLQEEALQLWEWAGTPKDSTWVRANACCFRGRVAKASACLDEAARCRAELCDVRAQMAERDRLLQAALEHRIAEGGWLDQAAEPDNARETRGKADELRERIAQLQDHPEADTERTTETTPLLLSPRQGGSEASDPALGSVDDRESEEEMGGFSATLWGLCYGCCRRS